MHKEHDAERYRHERFLGIVRPSAKHHNQQLWRTHQQPNLGYAKEQCAKNPSRREWERDANQHAIAARGRLWIPKKRWQAGQPVSHPYRQATMVL